MVTEFGFDANRDGPVEERGTYAVPVRHGRFHLGVFATKPWLSGAMYFALQDYVTFPAYSGGDPRPDPPFDQKGLVDLAGQAQAARSRGLADLPRYDRCRSHRWPQAAPPPPGSGL